MKKQYWLNLAAYSCFVAQAGWVVYNFYHIVFEGQTVIGFEGYTLNVAELVFAVGVFSLAVERYVHFIRRGG